MIAITISQFIAIAFLGVAFLFGIGMLVIIKQHRYKEGKYFFRRHGIK